MITGADLLLIAAGYLAGIGTVLLLVPRRVYPTRRGHIAFRPVHRLPHEPHHP